MGASVDSGREVSKIPCNSLSSHQGAIYAWDFERSRILSWKPGEPATREDEEDRVLRTAGINNFGNECCLSVSPSGELIVMDYLNDRLLQFQGGHGHVVIDNLFANHMVCSPNGLVYLLVPGDRPGQVVQKLVGSTLETVIDSESLPEDLQFSTKNRFFVTKEEVIYFTDNWNSRILCVNPAESLEPVVVGELPSGSGEVSIAGLFVTEGGAIYVSEFEQRKVWTLHPGETTFTEVLRCPDLLWPGPILVHDKSLYVGMADLSRPLLTGAVYEYSLPPEVQFE